MTTPAAPGYFVWEHTRAVADTRMASLACGGQHRVAGGCVVAKRRAGGGAA